MLFDAAAMRDIDIDEDDDITGSRSRGRIVELVVSPGLYKRGNTNGQGFDTETCMERSEVKCRESWSEGRSDVKLESPLSVIEVSGTGLFSEPQPLERLEAGFGRTGEPLHLQHFQPTHPPPPIQPLHPPLPSLPLRPPERSERPERLEREQLELERLNRRRLSERSERHRSSERSDGDLRSVISNGGRPSKSAEYRPKLSEGRRSNYYR